MTIKFSRSSVLVLIGMLALVGLAVASQLPYALKYSDKYNLRYHAHAFLETSFDLANTAEANLQGYGWGRRFKNLIQAGLVDHTYPAKMDEIHIDIKFRHWMTLNQDRDTAFEKEILREPHWVPAKINYKGDTIKTEIRLKGHQGEHRYLPNRWSLRLKLKNGKTIHRFNQFTLLRPSARQFPSDFMFENWLRAQGGLSPKFDFVRVYVNGDYWGVMMMEEHINKNMLELNERKDAPLFKLVSHAEEGGYFDLANRNTSAVPQVFYSTGNASLYRAGKYSGDERMLRLFSYAYNHIKLLNHQAIAAEDILDLPAFARPYIMTKAWGSGHTLNLTNSRFYLNPYTLLVEPITTDQTRYEPVNENNFRPDTGGLFALPLQDPAFRDYAPRIMRNIEDTVGDLTKMHTEVCRNFPIDCPTFDPQLFANNVAWIKQHAMPAWQAINRDKVADPTPLQSVDLSQPGPAQPDDQHDDQGVDYPEHVYGEHYDDGELRIYNYLSRPVEIVSVRISCAKKAPKSCQPTELLTQPINLPGSMQAGDLHFTSLDTHMDDLGRGRNITITTRRNGTTNTALVELTLRRHVTNPLLTNRKTFSDTPRPEWLKIQGDIATIQPGTWRIEKPLILPMGMKLNILPGTTLLFSERAYMIVRGMLTANGSAQAPIRFAPTANTWKGLYVLEAQDRSQLSHVTIERTTFLSDGALNLTGGVTFYKSDVDFSHTQFVGSIAEDALNIVHSDFSMSESTFTDARSDAFDSDFNTGRVTTSRFTDVKGDGVDMSGSNLILSSLHFTNIHDKAVSVGERSTAALQDIDVSTSGSAVVSKDGSRTTVETLTVHGSKGYAVMAYVKKPVYGSAILKINSSNLTAQDAFNQTGNTLTLSGTEVFARDINVDDLYKSEQMKK